MNQNRNCENKYKKLYYVKFVCLIEYELVDDGVNN